VVAHLLPEAEQLHKVTIIPRGAALGATMILPEKDRYHHRRNELLTNIKVLYAGRIAEQKFCNDISGGAKNDIDRATEIARMMVCNLGMSDKIGPISYAEQHDHVFLGEELVRGKQHSEEVAKQIDEEVKQILDTCYNETDTMLEAHREQIEIIAQALMKYETLTGEEVAALIGGKSPDAIDFEYDPEKEVSEEPEKATDPIKPTVEEDEPGLDPGDLPAAGEPAY
jgi:cell division protease FtsH